MTKNKKGQFYLIAVLVIIAIFIGFVTISNYTEHNPVIDSQELKEEIQIEKRNVLDYISSENLDDTETENIFTNFSNQFITKIGEDKNIIFMFGKTNSIKLVGNIIAGTSVSYNVDGSFVELSEIGLFEKDLIAVTENLIILKIDGSEYSFELFAGQNIYYLIKYNYDNEVYIIHD